MRLLSTSPDSGGQGALWIMDILLLLCYRNHDVSYFDLQDDHGKEMGFKTVFDEKHIK